MDGAEYKKIPSLLIRGGTSKGLFFDEAVLPPTGSQRDQLLLAIMGSPDSTGMQLDGMGGGISSTSKVAIIRSSERSNIDVDYLFGQVSLKKPEIDWKGSCGNLAAAVGLYALHKGLVHAKKDGSASVRVWQANLSHELRLEIAPRSDLISLPGVPRQNIAISVEFMSPESSDSLIPNGQPVHELEVFPGKKIEATIIHGANPTLFVKAEDLGLSGKELPKDIDFSHFESLFKNLCMQGAAIMEIPYTAAVRVAWLSPPTDYTTSDSKAISQTEVDLLSRISTEGRVHHAFTGTGGICLACAARIPGTLPFQMFLDSSDRKENAPIRIGHPMGVMQVSAKVSHDLSSNKWLAISSGFMRTARIIMEGDVFA